MAFRTVASTKSVRVSPGSSTDSSSAAARQRDPALRCEHAQRDATLASQIGRVWRASMQVRSVDKNWRQLQREGVPVARCTWPSSSTCSPSGSWVGGAHGLRAGCAGASAVRPAARDAAMGVLVQPPPAIGAHRLHPASRSRGNLLQSTYRAGQVGLTHTTGPPRNPGRFNPHWKRAPVQVHIAL